MQHWTKKTNKKTVQFHQWEIHHCFLLVTILHNYIHCSIRQSKTVQFHRVGNSPPFSAGHHCFPFHTLQHWTKQNNNNNKSTHKKTRSISPSGKFTTVFCWSPIFTITYNATLDQTEKFNFTKWEIHHYFLLVIILHHYIQCNTGVNKAVQFHQVGNSPLFSAGHHSSPLHTMQHWSKQSSSVSPSGKFTLDHHLNCNSGSSKKLLVPPSGKFTIIFCQSPLFPHHLNCNSGSTMTFLVSLSGN